MELKDEVSQILRKENTESSDTRVKIPHEVFMDVVVRFRNAEPPKTFKYITKFLNEKGYDVKQAAISNRYYRYISQQEKNQNKDNKS